MMASVGGRKHWSRGPTHLSKHIDVTVAAVMSITAAPGLLTRCHVEILPYGAVGLPTRHHVRLVKAVVLPQGTFINCEMSFHSLRLSKIEFSHLYINIILF